jgi:hypothetical protein
MKAVFALYIALVTITGSAFCAQEIDTVLLTPGHGLLKGGRLKEGASSFTFLLTKNGQQQKAGGLKEQLHVVSLRGKKCYQRVCHISFGANNILDSGLAEQNTLQPLYHRSYQTNKVMRFEFMDALVSGTITHQDSTGEHTEPVRHITRGALFDSYYEDIIARCIAFKKGLVFKFSEYIYERGGEVWSNGEVVGQQLKQDGKGRLVKAWAIRYFEKSAAGATVRETTYFIDAHDRHIISREYKMGSAILLMQANG